MPAFVALKQTNMAWTDDGRLVLLGESRRTLVAVWRPGEDRLAVRAVRLPGAHLRQRLLRAAPPAVGSRSRKPLRQTVRRTPCRGYAAGRAIICPISVPARTRTRAAAPG